MILTLVQARFNSNRLQGKSLFKINGKTLTEYVLSAAIKSNSNCVGLIYPKKEENEFKKFDIFKFGGNELNVLDRYYEGVKYFEEKNKIKVDHIIRLTADCPLLFYYPEIINNVIKKHLDEKNDFTHNKGFMSYPSGLDVEIMTKETLDISHQIAKKQEELEHVTIIIKNNPSKFKIGNLPQKIGKSNEFKCKWSIDTFEDFKRVEDVIFLLERMKGNC
jgi:spore coat polysaccharide biosynthesis protein SpsF